MAHLLAEHTQLHGQGLVGQALGIEQDPIARSRQRTPGLRQFGFAHPGDLEAPVLPLPVLADVLGHQRLDVGSEHQLQQLLPALRVTGQVIQ